MSTQRAKTEKIDLNPKRVQNPFQHLKRSPGKFDQRVYMEQELSSSNRVRFYNRLYSTQQRSQLSQHEKYIAELQRKGSILKARNEEYTYLNALRTALNKERERRLSGAQTARPATPEEVRRRFRVERRRSVSGLETQPETNSKGLKGNDVDPVQAESQPAGTKTKETFKIETVTKTIEQVSLTEQMDVPPPTTEQMDVPPPTTEPIVEPNTEDKNSETRSVISEEPKPEPKKKKIKRRQCPVSANRLTTLESLSYEIMTNTLPISKMKRILPEAQVPIHEKWPLLSNYRKQTVLPSVKAGKQRLTDDMSKLHTKINEYFKCDNFPLWQYKYVPPDYPTKYKLLKAIETEQIHLPTLPKH